MNTNAVILLTCAFCGVLMVAGGLLLFYKGIVKLDEASSKANAVTIDILNSIKIQTRYAAFGFFVFGLAFVVIAALFGRPVPLPPITLTGTIVDAVDPASTRVRVHLPLWDTQLSDTGLFKKKLVPDLTQVRVEIQAPGNEPSSVAFEVDTTEEQGERVATFKPVKLKKVGNVPSAGSIEVLAPGLKLVPPRGASGLTEATQ